MYFHENGDQYPRNGAVGNPNSESDIQSLSNFLVPKYLAQIPNDPKKAQGNYQYVWKNGGKDYGLLVPFANDGGISCQWNTPGGSGTWFGGVPLCNY
jgi:hypothetical protein